MTDNDKDCRSVAVTCAADYEPESVTGAIRRQFALLGVKARIDRLLQEKPQGPRVLLKPNLLIKRRPEEATTTHPAVVAGVIACLQELGVKDITIADSPGGPYAKAYLNQIYEGTGLRKVADAAGDAVHLNLDCSSGECRLEQGVMSKSFTIITPVRKADFIINLPKLKTHGMMTLSGGVKNLFGCIPGLMKPEMHWRFPENERFAEMLVDLAEAVHPDLTLCDGIVAMEGDGPSGGTPRAVGALLGAWSPFSLDVALCRVLSLEPDRVPTVRAATARGLCPSSWEELTILGDTLPVPEKFQLPRSRSVDFTKRLPGFLRPAVNRLMRDRPEIRKKDCIGCGKCAESCPAKTIRIVDRKAHIRHENCIRCYCCHEMCPVKAIDIKRFRIFDF